MAAFLPCCGRAELPPAAARPAQELPFGRSSGDSACPLGGGAPNSCERAREQAPLSGAFKTSKISYCTGRGDARPSPALEAAHMYPAGAAPLARGLRPRAAESAPRLPAGRARARLGKLAGGRLALAQLGGREPCGLVGGHQGVPEPPQSPGSCSRIMVCLPEVGLGG